MTTTHIIVIVCEGFFIGVVATMVFNKFKLRRLRVKVEEGTEIANRYNALNVHRQNELDPRVANWGQLTPDQRVQLRRDLDKWFRECEAVDLESEMFRKRHKFV